MGDPNILHRLLPASSTLLAVATNQAQSTEPTFDITEQATSFNGGNFSEDLQVIMDDRDLLPQLLSNTSPIAMNDSGLVPQLLPNTLAPIVNETQSSYLSPSVVQLIPEGANSLIHDHDITSMSGFIQLNNPELFQQTTNFNDHQSFSYVPSVEENLVDAGAGTGTGIPNGHFMTNNQISLSPHLHNYYINPHMTWNSQGLSEPFNTMLHQDIHDPYLFDIQSQHYVQPAFQTYPRVEPYLQPNLVPMPPNIYDNQHAYMPLLPEPPVSFGYDNQNNQYHSIAMMPNGHVEQGVSSFVQVSGGSMQLLDQRNDVHNQLLNTPNLQGHSSTMHEGATLSSNFAGSQVMGSRIAGISGFRMIEGTSSQVRLPQMARRPTMYPNYHTHPSGLGGACNFFGSAGSSVPIIYDNRDNQYHSQAMMPDGYVEQAVGNSVQLSGGSTRVLYQGNDEQNQLWGASSVQGQGSTMYQPTTLPSNFTGPQAMRSRNMGLLGIRITEGTSSQAQVSETAGLLRPEKASNLQLEQVAPVSAKRPTMWKNWKGKNGEEYEPPRRGRPRKRFEVGESSSCSKRRKIEKDSPGIENDGTIPAPEEANNTPENLRNEVQNSNPANPSPAATSPRELSNGLYDLIFQRNGVPTDPHLRLFKPPPEK